MIDGLEVVPIEFDSNTSYVLVKLDIGKMTPRNARRYVERCRGSMSLFKELDKREIAYDIVGVRSRKDFNMEVESETVNELAATSGMVKARQNLLKVMANRNELLKTDSDLKADCKDDNFADAMKLVN